MTASLTDDLKQRYAGDLSEGEKQVRTIFRDVLHAALAGQISFRDAIIAIFTRLSILHTFCFDVDKAIASGEFNPAAPQEAVALSGEERNSAVLSETERAFLEDADGLIEWATRNGVSFTLMLETLGHDIFGLYRDNFQFNNSLHSIMPKVTGWAGRNTEAVGEADEQM